MHVSSRPQCARHPTDGAAFCAREDRRRAAVGEGRAIATTLIRAVILSGVSLQA